MLINGFMPTGLSFLILVLVPTQTIGGPTEMRDGRPEFAQPHWAAIPRVQWKGEESLQELEGFVKRGEPVVLTNTTVVDVSAWTNEYLEKSFGSKPLLVKRSSSNKFRYFAIDKNKGNFSFRAPLEESHMTFGDFLEEARRLSTSGSSSRLYCQETMSGHEEMADEFKSWDWAWLLKNAIKHKWGLPDTNEMFVGMAGATTPLHFDERENLLLQIRGEKLVVLFPFVEYNRMYPFPVTHPCDRQSMVDIETPDHQRFPKFRDANGNYTVLHDGDLLYIPYGWWHWLKNLDDLAISMSFWSLTPPENLDNGLPDKFSATQLTRVQRNLETLLSQQVTPELLPAAANQVLRAIETGARGDVLDFARAMLSQVKVGDPKDQDQFLIDAFGGRFEGDWDRWV